MHEEVIAPRAFIPNTETIFKADGIRYDLSKDVIYLSPHAIPPGYVLELVKMGRGRVV